MAAKEVVLVTGGAGYIGSHCAVELLNAGYEVVTVDNLSNCRSGALRRVEELTGKKVTFYNCDLLDGQSLKKIFTRHKIGFVIHFAASKNVGESIKDPFLYYKNNLISSINLLETMAENDVFQLVFSSSCSVYGEPETFPIFETLPTGKVTSSYGRTKYIIEEIIKDLSRAEPKWNVISLRYFNPIGAHPSGQLGEDNTKSYTNLVPLISHVAMGQLDKLTVFGSDYDTPDGTAIRDYIHIMDLVEGHVIALNKLKEEHVKFKPYNLGLGRGLTVLELIREFEKVSGKTVAYELKDRREGDVPRLVCDASLAAKELGWTPKRNVTDMCEDFWRWQTMNPNGYKDEAPFKAASLELTAGTSELLEKSS